MRMQTICLMALCTTFLSPAMPAASGQAFKKTVEYNGVLAYRDNKQWRPRIRQGAFLAKDERHASCETRRQIVYCLRGWCEDAFFAGTAPDEFEDFKHVASLYPLDEFCPGEAAGDDWSLAKLLEDYPLPDAWEVRDFRAWIAETLHGSQPLPPLPSETGEKAWDEQEQVQTFVFCLETAGTAAKAHWEPLWSHGKAKQVSIYHQELEDLFERRGELGLIRYTPAVYEQICKTMGGLFLDSEAIPVPGWPDVELSSLVTLAGYTPGSHLAFIRTQADELRAKPASRSASQVAIHFALAEKAAPAGAIMAALEPGDSAQWLTWLHEKQIVQKLNDREPGLLSDGLDRIARFRDAPEFDTLFGFLRDHYYAGLPQRTFNEFLRPEVEIRGNRAKLVLNDGGAALRGD